MIITKSSSSDYVGTLDIYSISLFLEEVSLVVAYMWIHGYYKCGKKTTT